MHFHHPQSPPPCTLAANSTVTFTRQNLLNLTFSKGSNAPITHKSHVSQQTHTSGHSLAGTVVDGLMVGLDDLRGFFQPY